MSFFDSMRRFFGLDNEYNTDELNDSDISAETSDSNPQADENPQDSALTPDLNGDENAALPPRPAVDPDIDRKSVV